MAPHEGIEFITAEATESIVSVLPEEERTLLGELLFLKVWNLLKRNAEPLKISSKVVGILLRLPLPELQELVAVPKKFQDRLTEALKAVGVQVATEGPEGKALPAPPPQRQGQLLYLALMGLVANDRELCTFLASKLKGQLGDEVIPCLVDEKKLKAAMKSMTRSWEKDLKEQETAQILLRDFERLEPQARAQQLMKSGDTNSSSKVKAAQLLKAARKVVAKPEVVGYMVAQAFLASGQSLMPPLLLLFEECGVSRAELSAMGARLPRVEEKGEKGEKRRTRSASRAAEKKRGRERRDGDAEKRTVRRASADGRLRESGPAERARSPKAFDNSVRVPQIPREPGRQMAPAAVMTPPPVPPAVTAVSKAKVVVKVVEANEDTITQTEAKPEVAEAQRSRRSASVAPSEAPRPSASARAASAEVGRQEPRKSAKRKGHVWSPMTDAFEAARKQSDEVATAKPKAKPKEAASGRSSSDREKGEVPQHELRLQLQALAESKLRAVESEDFELAQKLKQQEQELQRLCTSKSWAALLVSPTPVPPPSRGLVFRKNVGNVPKAGPAAPHPPAPAASAASVAPVASAPSAGKLVFVLTAPGELTPESFKATTTHVARRDALARIATAALWRGRNLAWDDIHEIVFIFEDYRALHMSPRFVASCPVPSEYHLIMVLQRALEGSFAPPGLQITGPDRDRFLGGHIDDAVAKYARAGPTSVVLLHETYPQSLGLYDEDLRDAGDASRRSLIFFLGAVKDMTPEESRAVVKACRTHEVPCVEANLGQQAEFTSKIIDVLHGHHVHFGLRSLV
eukprot:symbB.v1.2.004075.t1/scaffold200.1/size464218/5